MQQQQHLEDGIDAASEDCVLPSSYLTAADAVGSGEVASVAASWGLRRAHPPGHPVQPGELASTTSHHGKMYVP